MIHLSSSSALAETQRMTYQRATRSLGLLPAASILPLSTGDANIAGTACSRSDDGHTNDTETPKSANAGRLLVASGTAQKIDSDTSSSNDSNHSPPRTNVQKSRAPTASRHASFGAAVHKKLRSTRISTAAVAAAAPVASSDGNNLHNSNLFICNLDTNVSQAELETAFAECGTILSSAVMRDIHTGASLGTAFVRMSSHEEARRTMEAMNGVHIGSRSISVQWARRHEGAPVGEARKKIMKLFVRNVPLDCTKADLEELFGAYGSVRQVTLHKDTSPVQDEAMVRLIAFVIYTEEGAAERAAREVHNTKPFASCNGIPIMVKLAEDLAKHYREHSHHHHQHGDLNTTSSAAKPRPRRSYSQRNRLGRISNEGSSRKESVSSGNAYICPGRHTLSNTPNICAAQSSDANASMAEMCAAAEAFRPRNHRQVTPPQCNELLLNAPVGAVMRAPLSQHHTMKYARGTLAPTAELLSSRSRLQSLGATPSAFGGGMLAAVTPAYGEATATALMSWKQLSLTDFSLSQVQQSFFLNRPAPPLVPFEQQQLYPFSQAPSTALVTPKFSHSPAADMVADARDERAAVAIPAPRFASSPGYRRFMNDSNAAPPSGRGGEEHFCTVDTAPAAHALSLHPRQNFAAVTSKKPQTYRHNPYINCSFMRVS
ncbi:hypothetical protein LSCM1_04432 [Leishmania martiniquensis]|uniref:RRM domain-containing protein n=1 Tax=Leishmania martiniquensis TaxID=1580590 RepID=A0A836G2H3_9TRYP|nr:hypothetical protein LSCM1_04432 [Leishmania martiniquensis]